MRRPMTNRAIQPDYDERDQRHPPDHLRALAERLATDPEARALIRQTCLDCQHGDAAAVANCTSWACVLWKHRGGD